MKACFSDEFLTIPWTTVVTLIQSLDHVKQGSLALKFDFGCEFIT